MSSNITNISPAGVAKPGGHYSHAVVAAGLVHLAGQLPIRADGHKLAEASFEVQAAQIFSNIDAILHAAGTSKARLLQVRVYITDIELWPSFNTLYAEWLGDARPARAVVPVPLLHYGFKLEVEAVALA